MHQIAQKHITDFDLFLKSIILPTGRGFEANTIQKHHSRFRTILIKAQKESLLDKNPYFHFKLKKSKSKRTFLTQGELDAIIGLDLAQNLSLDRVRDLFIFSVYTGLRFDDAQSLTKNEIQLNESGKLEIALSQKKTGEFVKIPILNPAKEIIEKYDHVTAIDGKGRVLPKLTNQKTNAYLKVIADLAGINKILTHHVARHTCATTILLANEIPIEAVSGWLGHTNIKTTQIYAKITEDYLAKMAVRVTEKLDERDKQNQKLTKNQEFEIANQFISGEVKI